MSIWTTSTDYSLKTREAFVADQLREGILRGYFKPGQKLDQTELADLLKVSRSPVREALRTLAAEELVKMYPHRGAVVTELTVEELEEIYFLRGTLEGLATRLAATKIDDKRLDQLDAIFKKLEQATNLDEWVALNREFHLTIYRVINRPRLISLISSLRNISAPYTRAYIATPKFMDKTQLAHKNILDALRRRDEVQAEAATRNHLKVICDGVLVTAESILTSAADSDDKG